uniref:F-box protein n=1 Tax=Syphacia muris TaxID=451379 RepID=A0A0N5AXW1_9BILA
MLFEGLKQFIIQQQSQIISLPVSSLMPSTSTNAPVIELLHLRAFFDRRGVKPLLIHPVMRDRQGVFCDPFIYRNHLYLFDYFASTLICISMVGEGKGDVRLLNTYGDPIHQHPNLKYVHKCHLVFGDILLVYFYQHADRPDAEPQLWKLELGSMSWYKLQLSLSYHSPSQRVCLQQAAGQPFAYLHGECGRSDCAEKVHLYQLTLDISCVKPNLREKLAEFVEKTILPEKATAAVVEKSNDKVRRSLSNVDMHDTAPSTSSSNRSVTSSCLSKYLASESAKPPSLRYAMRRRNMEKVF